MYFLFISSTLMFLHIIYIYIFGVYGVKKDIEAFDYKNKECEFIVDNIKFYKDDKHIKTLEYNKEYSECIKTELNVDFIYDFLVVDYYYNSKNYKFLSDNGVLTFPIYSNEKIKTYVYTNKIKLAEIKLSEINDESSVILPGNITITDVINEFVGPNYNFYKDLDYKFKSEYLISYLKAENILEKSEKNVSFKFIFYDNFNNEYSIYDDYLTWDPNLRM